LARNVPAPSNSISRSRDYVVGIGDDKLVTRQVIRGVLCLYPADNRAHVAHGENHMELTVSSSRWPFLRIRAHRETVSLDSP